MSVQNTRASRGEIAGVLAQAKKLWFIGIGGVHMSALALYAAGRFEVAGSDIREGEGTARLRRAGVEVTLGHDPGAVAGADAVIYTLALSPDDPEYCAAKELHIPLFSRADLLGYLMLAYPCRIGVAGSHGKSTVTAMTADIFASAGRCPTVFCGAPIRAGGSTCLFGKGEDFIFEACEYEDSFLCFSPTLAVALNVELDHVDYFGDLAALEKSFAAWCALPGETGTALYFAGDPLCAACAEKSVGKKASFGFDNADYSIRDLTFRGGCGTFALHLPDGGILPVTLAVAGEHNVKNAAAAAAAAHLCGVPAHVIGKALQEFRGAARRMEYKGAYFGARFYDDYAHHPTEVRASLQTARLLMGRGGRLYTVFQSHTYSRTAAFFEEFCRALRLADRVFVADIYAAREQDTLGMSGAVLAAGIGKNASYVGGFSEIAAALEAELSPLDLVVVMGAGDVGGLFAEFAKKGFTRT